MNKITALQSSLTYITEKREDRVSVLEHKYLGDVTYCVNTEYEIAWRHRCQKNWLCLDKKEDF